MDERRTKTRGVIGQVSRLLQPIPFREDVLASGPVSSYLDPLTLTTEIGSVGRGE